MEIVATNYGCYFDAFRLAYPPEFHGCTGYSERHRQLRDEVSEGELGEICFHGVRIHYGRFQTRQSDTIQTTEDFPSVEMVFQLAGQTARQSSVPAGFAPRQHNLSYRPYADTHCRLEAGRHEYVGVQFTEAFFGRLADDDSPTLSRLLNKLIRRETAALTDRNLFITPALQTTALALTQSGHQPLKRLYLEATVLDLLRQQIQLADRREHKPAGALSPADVEKVMAVKSRLETSPLGDYSLLQLSRWAGLNEYKLKRGFRQVLGTTVFGFLHELRMNHAHQLLRDGGRTVGEVAQLLNYRETHHFSTAFRRTFGYLPSRLVMTR